MTLLDGIIFIWFLVGSILMMVMSIANKDFNDRD